MLSRNRLSSILHKLGFVEGILRLRSRFGSSYLTVLTYHRVFELPEDYRFDRGVVDVAPEAFDTQLRTLKRYFNVIGIDELSAHVKGEEKLPSNAAMVTFDDGYLDNLRIATPILKDHGMKAVFFIATSYIENRRMYWWDRVNYLLNSAKVGLETVELSYPTSLRLKLGAADRTNSLNTLLRLLKFQFGLDMERLLTELAERLGVRWDRELERELSEGLLMTWDDVRALRKEGMDVQSHTRTHRSLQTVPLTELTSELTGAKHDLERELGETVSAISYPIGKSIAPLGEVVDAIRGAGYQFGFTNGSGPQKLGGSEIDYLDIHRIAMEPDWLESRFRSMVAIPRLGA